MNRATNRRVGDVIRRAAAAAAAVMRDGGAGAVTRADRAGWRSISEEVRRLEFGFTAR